MTCRHLHSLGALAPVSGLLMLILGLTLFAGPLTELTSAMAVDLLAAAQIRAVLGAEGQ